MMSMKEIIDREVHRKWNKLKEEGTYDRQVLDRKFKTVFFGAQRTNPYMFDKWNWLDGSEIKWTNWENGDWKHEKNMGMCGAMTFQDDKSYKWKTVSCHNTNLDAVYICSMNATFGKN